MRELWTVFFLIISGFMDDLFLPYVMSFGNELKIIPSAPNGIVSKIALVPTIRNGFITR